MRCRSQRCCLLVSFLLLFQSAYLLYLLNSNLSLQWNEEFANRKCLCGLRDARSNNSSGQSRRSSATESLISQREQVFLFVVVLSDPGGKERRNVIRNTWMRGHETLQPKVLVKFVIGEMGISSPKLSSLQEEQKQYGDLLLLEDLYESYRNLTLKVLLTFVHVSQSFNTTYLMKCDDDTFMLLEPVLKELVQRDHRMSFYWGFFNGRARVKRNGKWQERGWFLSNNYLPYALGGGYVLSGDMIKRVANNANGLQLYHSEDVSVGVWVSSFKAERKHDVRFNTEYKSRGCLNVYIVSHKQSISDMKLKYQNMRLTGRQCYKEYQTRLSYVYNWTVPPSECCQRLAGIP